MKKFIKKHKSKLLLIVGLLIGGVIGVSADEITTIFSSSEVSYSNENMDATNVQDAIDELYEKAFPPVPPEPATDYITTLASTDSTLITDDYGNIRYSGKNVNNYVCMDSEETTCSDANLYRIIGVFSGIKKTEGGTGETRIKLIKATNNGNAYWNNSTNNNNWNEASLKNTLNSASTPIYSSSLIDDAVWNIGGHTDNEVTAKEMYNYERGNATGNNNAYPTTWTGKVALMYPSDYGYASSSCKDASKTLWDYSDSTCKESNWLFGNQSDGTQKDEWFLTPRTDYSDLAWILFNSGHISCNFNFPVYNASSAVRPAVYLKSNVLLVTDGRDGSSTKPYLLSQ